MGDQTPLLHSLRSLPSLVVINHTSHIYDHFLWDEFQPICASHEVHFFSGVLLPKVKPCWIGLRRRWVTICNNYPCCTPWEIRLTLRCSPTPSIYNHMIWTKSQAINLTQRFSPGNYQTWTKPACKKASELISPSLKTNLVYEPAPILRRPRLHPEAFSHTTPSRDSFQQCSCT